MPMQISEHRRRADQIPQLQCAATKLFHPNQKTRLSDLLRVVGESGTAGAEAVGGHTLRRDPKEALQMSGPASKAELRSDVHHLQTRRNGDRVKVAPKIWAETEMG